MSVGVFLLDMERRIQRWEDPVLEIIGIPPVKRELFGLLVNLGFRGFGTFYDDGANCVR